MNRRLFCRNTLLGLGLASISPTTLFASEAKKFKMKFAPRVTMKFFKTSAGNDVLARIKFFSDMGFTAFEGPCGGNSKKYDFQKEVGKLAKDLNMEIGCISSMNEKDFATMTANDTPSSDRKSFKTDKVAMKEYLHKQLEDTNTVLKNLGCKRFIIGPGLVSKNLPWEKQLENSIENMKFCADYCEKNDIVALIEPLNLKSHPGQFCDKVEVGAKICKSVNSPNCRVLYDIFHEQMEVGNLDTLDSCWSEIGYFHVADAPGRNEPGSGNIDYKSVFKKIWDKGYRGCLGLEHGQSKQDKETDEKILETYRSFDKII